MAALTITDDKWFGFQLVILDEMDRDDPEVHCCAASLSWAAECQRTKLMAVKW